MRLIFILLVFPLHSIVSAQWTNADPTVHNGSATLESSSDHYLNFKGTGFFQGVRWVDSSNDPLAYFLHTNGEIFLSLNGTSSTVKVKQDRVSIFGKENNGVDSAPLQIQDTGTDFMLIDANEIETVNAPLYINHNGSQNVFLVTGGGKVGIGTQSPTEKLHVAGDVLVAGFVSQPSDARLKKNILPAPNSLDKILKLNPRTYEYRSREFSDLGLPSGVQTGFIAQEVKEVFPEMVSSKEGESNFLTLSYDKLIPHLVGAIKEQQAEIQDLKKVLKALLEPSEE